MSTQDKLRLKVKNLHGAEFFVECKPEDTTETVRKFIADRDDLPEKYNPDLFKLVYKGKVLEDDDAIQAYEIAPDGFLVLVKLKQKRPKPIPKKKPNPYAYPGYNSMGGFNSPFGGMGSMSSGLSPHSLNHDPFMQPSLQLNAQIRQPFAQNLPGPAFNSGFSMQPRMPAYQPHQPTYPMNPQPKPQPAFVPQEDNFDANLENLLGMGFERDKIKKALRASANVLDLALNFLTDDNIPDIPEDNDTPAPPSPPSPPSPPPPPVVVENQTPRIPDPQPSQPSPAIDPAPEEEALSVNLQQINQMLQQNPEQLQMLKHAIAEQNPEMAKMIDENPQAFLELLKEAGIGGVAGESASSGGSAQAQQPDKITVHLSYQEQQIIDRLQEMGFDRNRALEAFLACDRNEEVAINYLLSSTE